MLIPIRIATGSAFVDCLVTETTVLNAGCQVTYDGQVYAADTDIPVEKGETVRLTTTIVGYAEIPVQLGANLYHWFVDVPKTTRFATPFAFKNLTGTTYGKMYNYGSEPASELSYSASGAFTGGDSLAVIDYVKNHVWFFNDKDEVKRLDLTSKPVSIVFTPRWAAQEEILTTVYVVCVDKIHRLNSTFDVEQSWDLTDTPVAAVGDTSGRILLAYGSARSSLDRWDNGAVTALSSDNENTANIHSLYMLENGALIVGNSRGVMRFNLHFATPTFDMLYAKSGAFIDFSYNLTTLYFVDAANRSVNALTVATGDVKTVLLSDVPRSVVIDGDSVYVGFFDKALSKKYDMALDTSIDISTARSAGAASYEGYRLTNLYSDAAAVTTAETNVAPTTTLVEFEVDVERTHTFVFSHPRPDYVRLGETTAVVTVNGEEWTEGWLESGDEITVTLPPESRYYHSAYVSFLGLQPVTLHFRTEAKLFPDLYTIPQVTEAFLNFDYRHTYAVEGITDGFTSELTSDSNELTFSVNGGEFVSTATVKSGDTLEVVVRIKSLITQRQAHTISAATGDIATSWTVLVLELSGVTVRKDTHRPKDRYPVIESDVDNFSKFDAIAAYGGTSPSFKSPELVSARYSCEFAGTYLGTVDSTPVTTKMLKLDIGLPELLQSSGLFHEYADALLLQQTVFSTPYNDTVVRSEHYLYTGIFEHNVYYSPTVLVNQYDSVALSSVSQVRLDVFGYRRHGFYPNHYDVEATVTMLNPSTGEDVPFFSSRGVTVTDSEYVRDYLSAEAPVSDEVDVHSATMTPRSSDEVTLEALGAYPAGSVALLDVLYGTSDHTSAYRVSVPSWERGYKAQTRYFFGIYGLHKEMQIKSVEAMPAAVRSNASTYASNVYSMADYRRGVELNKPTFSVASRRVSDSQLNSSRSAMFDTQEDAEAYAESIGLGSSVPKEFFQVQGKWVFITDPEIEYKSCAIDPPVPGEGEVYGYVGGG